jgi:hypothetical protein
MNIPFSTAYYSFVDFNHHYPGVEFTRDNFFTITYSYFLLKNIQLEQSFIEILYKNKNELYRISCEVPSYTPDTNVQRFLRSIGLKAKTSSFNERCFIYALYLLPFLQRYKGNIYALSSQTEMSFFLNQYECVKKIKIPSYNEESTISTYFNIYVTCKMILSTVIRRSKCNILPLMALFTFGKMFQNGGAMSHKIKIIDDILKMSLVYKYEVPFNEELIYLDEGTNNYEEDETNFLIMIKDIV